MSFRPNWIKATSENRSAQSRPEFEKANAQRNKLQTKLDQVTSAIKSAQSRPELDKANTQRNMVEPGIWQRDLASYVEVGDFLIAQGNLGEALKSYQDALAVADRLAKVDPKMPAGSAISRCLTARSATC